MTEEIDSKKPSQQSPAVRLMHTPPMHTPLHSEHLRAGAKMVDFSGWSMPVNYGSQIEEHQACRTDAVVFDVSHMTILDLHGEIAVARQFLQRMLANNVARLSGTGDALYTCMLNESGGIIDDLIVYERAETGFRLIVNAGTREKDLQWLRSGLPDGLQIQLRTDLALLAIQGPNAREKIQPLLVRKFPELDPAPLKRFSSAESGDWFVGRTGYTGEDGVELALPVGDAISFWQDLLAQGISPAGLGARDTLRLEAGLNLYGNDMDEQVSPLESGISWTVGWEPSDRDFIGRAALEKQRDAMPNGPARCLLGVILEGRGIPRTGQQVCIDGKTVGCITSGTFSPTLKKSIGLVRFDRSALDMLPVEQLTGKTCDIMIRNKPVAARIVSPPFLK